MARLTMDDHALNNNSNNKIQSNAETTNAINIIF
jgi:hypothetical protein